MARKKKLTTREVVHPTVPVESLPEEDQKQVAAVLAVPVAARTSRFYTWAETRTQMSAIEQLMLRPESEHAIASLCKQQFGIGGGRTQQLMQRIRDRWTSEDSAARPAWKSAQIRRLQRMIKAATGYVENGKWVEKLNHVALAKYEELLASIQGTKDPLKIELDMQVSETALHVIADLTPEEVAHFVERNLENKRMAEEYRALLAAKESA